MVLLAGSLCSFNFICLGTGNVYVLTSWSLIRVLVLSTDDFNV